MNDSISRQWLMECVNEGWIKFDTEKDKNKFIHLVRDTAPSSQPEQHGRIFQEIVVEYPSISTYPEHEGKPYFSIKYVEDGQCHIGYGTYKPEVLSEYMKKYFISSAQPEIIRCKDCKHWRFDHTCHEHALVSPMMANDFCSRAERRGEQDDKCRQV